MEMMQLLDRFIPVIAGSLPVIIAGYFYFQNVKRETHLRTKLEAYEGALKLIDDTLSQQSDNYYTQTTNIAEARKYFTLMYLTCTKQEIYELFSSLIFIKEGEKMPELMQRLYELRKLMRKDLGFAKDIPYDENKVWLSKFGAINKAK